MVANYPYDGFTDHSGRNNGTRHPSPDDATFTHLAKVYAKAHKTMSHSVVRGHAAAGCQQIVIPGLVQKPVNFSAAPTHHFCLQG